MFFENIIHKAYNILTSDILLDLDLNLFPQLSCSQFAEYQDPSHQVGGANFAQLAKNLNFKHLFMVLQDHILSILELKAEFMNKNKKQLVTRICSYITQLQQFLHFWILLVHLFSSLPSQATELGTVKQQNSWDMHQRNLFLDSESHLFVLKLTYHKTANMTRCKIADAHFYLHILAILFWVISPCFTISENAGRKN